MQHRRTEDTRETGNTPSERSPSPISNDTTNYENIESNGEPISMDISSDSEPDEPIPERPRSARAWGTIYATELGKPTLYDGVGKEAHPILIWDCGKGFGPITYSFDDFMRLQDHQVVNIVLGIMTNSDDHKYPTSTILHRRQLQKDCRQRPTQSSVHKTLSTHHHIRWRQRRNLDYEQLSRKRRTGNEYPSLDAKNATQIHDLDQRQPRCTTS